MADSNKRRTFNCCHCDKIFGYNQSRRIRELAKHSRAPDFTDVKTLSTALVTESPVARVRTIYNHLVAKSKKVGVIYWLKSLESFGKDIHPFLEKYVEGWRIIRLDTIMSPSW